MAKLLSRSGDLSYSSETSLADSRYIFFLIAVMMFALCPLRAEYSTYTKTETPALVIPDNNVSGVVSSMTISGDMLISDLKVWMDITHTWGGDLTIWLQQGPSAYNLGKSAKIKQESGDDDQSKFNVWLSTDSDSASLTSHFGNRFCGGTWYLRAIDTGADDTGSINSWKLAVEGVAVSSLSTIIPSGSSTGLESLYTVTEDCLISSITVTADIIHENIGELSISLRGPDSSEVELKSVNTSLTGNIFKIVQSTSASGAQLIDSLSIASSAGDWYLVVKDTITGNYGYLNSWSIAFSTADIAIAGITDGADISGESKVIEVTAGSGITKVEFYIGGVLKHTDDSAPFSWTMDCLDYNAGTYQLEVKSYKGAVAAQSITRTINIVDSFYCVVAYPNPVRRAFGHDKITFKGSGVPWCKIEIYSVEGEKLTELRESAGLDTLEWNLETGRGALPSGIYIYSTRNSVEKNLGKFTVIR